MKEVKVDSAVLVRPLNALLEIALVLLYFSVVFLTIGKRITEAIGLLIFSFFRRMFDNNHLFISSLCVMPFLSAKSDRFGLLRLEKHFV